MSAQDRSEPTSQEPVGYRIKFRNSRSGGKTKKLLVHTPRAAYTYLETEFEEKRSKLIWLAYDVIGDKAMAEDIVQGSLLNAYRRLDNGNLYAVQKSQGSWILVRGGKHLSLYSDFDLLAKKDARSVEKWLRGEQVEGIEIIEKPFAWLSAIVQNNAYKYCKQRKQRGEFFMDSGNWELIEDPRYPDPEKEFIRAERCAEVREIVGALPIHYREIVQLRYLHDQKYDFRAIADKLNRPVHTVTSQSTRAHKVLKKALEAREKAS